MAPGAASRVQAAADADGGAAPETPSPGMPAPEVAAWSMAPSPSRTSIRPPPRASASGTAATDASTSPVSQVLPPLPVSASGENVRSWLGRTATSRPCAAGGSRRDEAAVVGHPRRGDQGPLGAAERAGEHFPEAVVVRRRAAHRHDRPGPAAGLGEGGGQRGGRRRRRGGGRRSAGRRAAGEHAARRRRPRPPPMRGAGPPAIVRPSAHRLQHRAGEQAGERGLGGRGARARVVADLLPDGGRWR